MLTLPLKKFEEAYKSTLLEEDDVVEGYVRQHGGDRLVVLRGGEYVAISFSYKPKFLKYKVRNWQHPTFKTRGQHNHAYHLWAKKLVNIKFIQLINTLEKKMKKRATITPIGNFKLCQYLVDNYTTMGLNDTEFAAKATEDLGFEVVPSHIQLRRGELNIEPTIKRRTTVVADTKPMDVRIAKIEADINTIATALGITL